MKSYRNEDVSPVIALIDNIYHNSNKAKGWSWLNLNSALHDGLMLAIEAQFKFELDDFQQISKRFKFGYWGGVDSDKMFGERYYRRAVFSKNRSACIAFEEWKNRKPYILNSERLADSSEFIFALEPFFVGMDKAKCLRVHITYIGADNIGFCYYDNEDNERTGAPLWRFTLTNAELKQAQKEGRAALTHQHAIDWLKAQMESVKTEEPTP